jgi:pimeloyl-ACP methyl ester carboxylesterase
MRLAINGAELCVDATGDPADPPVLLIMGAAASLDRWEDPFVARLAAAGRHVVRYDHRDTGASTTCPPGAPDYAPEAVVADAVGVLDALGIAAAHLVGMSMGGAIAQRLAIEHPSRVRTIALVSSTPIGAAGPDRPELPPYSDRLRPLFAGEQPREPDWDDREAVLAYLVEVERAFAAPDGFDEAHTRALLARVLDRSIDVRAGGNHPPLAGGERLPAGSLARVAVPALVVHGEQDPMFGPAHGEQLAREIPGARLLVLEGVGHELPPRAWDRVLPALIGLTAG